MADRTPSRSPRTNWGNFSKNLALWLVVGLLALALFQMMSRQRNPTQEFSYTEFSKQLDQGNVARVEVFDGKRLEGDFRNPVTQDNRSARSPTTSQRARFLLKFPQLVRGDRDGVLSAIYSRSAMNGR